MPYYSLDYQPDSTALFDHFVDLPYAVFLDSGQPRQSKGRFDIITAQPIATLTTDGSSSTFQFGDCIEQADDDPFTLVKHYLARLFPDTPTTDRPFSIGALGYFGYELGHELENLPRMTEHDIAMPDAMIGFYDWSIVVDHMDKKTWLYIDNNSAMTYDTIQKKIKQTPPKKPSFKLTSQFEANMTTDSYLKRFNRLMEHIRDGDCYQANLCQRFSAAYSGDTWAIYQYLRARHATQHAAYLHLPQGDILSFSPERFLQVHDRIVETKPIKGTSPRFEDPIKDQQSADKLLASSKDHAENLMIVDLLRNDLSRTCLPGSVEVPKLCALESYSNVHHLVSTVTGKLADSYHALDLLRCAFPGGSITGTPKISAMKIIDTLEPHHRSLYCGSIGYFNPNGDMDTSIVIRTLICAEQRMHCYAGGAIVSDSVGTQEYQETLDKVGHLLSAIEKY